MTNDTWQPQVYPLSIRDVPPGESYVRLEVQPVPGKPPEGMHTGGVWYHPVDPELIWKPLDGRPYANADCHVETREAEILMLLEGMPGFPRNWRIWEANGRRWLIRKRAYISPPHMPGDIVTSVAIIDTIEQALRALNAAGWTLNDHLNVALDADTYEPFILDLSAAWPQRNSRFCNDEYIWERWAEELGYDWLVLFRRAGRNIAQGRESRQREHLDWQWVYASYNRPLSFTWFPHIEGELLPGDTDRLYVPVHTWLATSGPLDDDFCKRYELLFAWAPWGPQEQEESQP